MNALVISHLHYPAIRLSGISANLMISLEKQSNWAVKTCCDRSKYDSSSDLKLKHNILPVTRFLDYKFLCLFAKIHHHLLPAYNKIEYDNHQIDIHTRNKKSYFVDRYNRQYRENSLDKLLDPREIELPDAAYEAARLADNPRYGKPCGSAQLAKTLAIYDRADPAAARVIIVAGSDFEGTSPLMFWTQTLVYSLPGAELNQMLTLMVAIKSEMSCEPELLLFAGMNDHLHATGFLEQLKGDEPAPKKIWEAIQTLFAAMNEVQENVASRFGPKTRVVFTTSPGYASMPPALQFIYAVLILIAEGNAWRILMAAPIRELEPTNLRLRKSELAAAWADVSYALRGFYELADILLYWMKSSC